MSAMRAADAFLSIDLGTSAVKAVVVNTEGHILGRAATEYPMDYPHPGYAEQDPSDWWRATIAAVRAALSAAATSIRAIGITGQMHGTVLLDEHGLPLSPAIIWPDTRSTAEVAQLTALIGPNRLLRIAGSPLATGFQAATIRWLQRHEPERWKRVRHVLLPKDYLRFALTGDFATDPSDASGTLLFDIHARNWSPDILRVLHLDRSILPAVFPSATITGELLPGPATELGLPAGIPVVAGGGDTACAALGACVVDANSMLLTISTGGQVILPSFTPAINLLGNSHTFCSTFEPGQMGAPWYHMGATMVAGLALRWLRDNIFALPKVTGYETMTAAAAAVPPGAGGLIFLPYLAGERTPHMNPHARGVFLGLTASHGRGHLVRAVMEGVAFALYDAYRALNLDGAVANRAILAGGGARSHLWRQIFSDMFGIPITPLDTADQSAFGAAILAASAVLEQGPASIARTWSRDGLPVHPD
ncbi:MAG TPA: xylulokinase, partial [Thermomicrobiales bacterium]|nr:xylulokinase [Thermomicrobiales bacterium]